MSAATPSPHTSTTDDEWLATYVAIIGLMFIACILVTPWFLFTDEDPRVQGQVIRYTTTVPVYHAPPPHSASAPPTYVQVVKGTAGPFQDVNSPKSTASKLLPLPNLLSLSTLRSTGKGFPFDTGSDLQL